MNLCKIGVIIIISNLLYYISKVCFVKSKINCCNSSSGFRLNIFLICFTILLNLICSIKSKVKGYNNTGDIKSKKSMYIMKN